VGPSAALSSVFSLTPSSVTHILYHANCPDGYGAAWAAWEKLGDNAKYIAVSYNEPVPALPPDARVAILDFSYPKEELLALKARIADLVVLDHHESAQRHLQGLPFAYFDMNHSGARLSWDYFHPGEKVPDLVSFVEDRDIWRWALPQSHEFSDGLNSWPMDFQQWELLSRDIDAVIREGIPITRFKAEFINRVCQRVRTEEIDGHKVPVVNAPYELASEVCSELLNRNPDAPFVASYYDDQSRNRQWELRSKGDFNVAVLAEKFGGGGHKHASGFRQPAPPTVVTPEAK